MKNVGFIGWRGMVGSVLMQRMVEERDFDAIRPVFFSTSQLGQAAPSFGGTTGTLQDAFDLEALKALDIIVTCQGGDYTNEIYPKLRESGWQGYWIDAASSLRMKDDAIIILDPVNQDVITDGLNNGIRTFVGGNCTVSLMLMSLGGLFANDRSLKPSKNAAGVQRKSRRFWYILTARSPGEKMPPMQCITPWCWKSAPIWACSRASLRRNSLRCKTNCWISTTCVSMGPMPITGSNPSRRGFIAPALRIDMFLAVTSLPRSWR